jgi:hypothetical protein
MQKSHHERSHSDTPPAVGGVAVPVSLSAESSSVASLPGLRRGSVSSQTSQASQVAKFFVEQISKSEKVATGLSSVAKMHLRLLLQCLPFICHGKIAKTYEK